MPQEEAPSRWHIAIVGPVGAGKSTLAQLLHERLNCDLYLEEPEDYPFVRSFYNDPQAWGFANTLNFIMVKFAQQARIYYDNRLAIQETHAQANHFVWTPVCHEIGHMSQAEVEIIDRVYEALVARPISSPDLIIILQASTDCLLNRIRQRGRDFESLDPASIRLFEMVYNRINQYIHAIANDDHVMVVDAEVVDLTRPSRLRDALIGDILGRVPARHLPA